MRWCRGQPSGVHYTATWFLMDTVVEQQSCFLPLVILPLVTCVLPSCVRLCLPVLHLVTLTGITIQGSPPPPPPKNRSHHLGAHSFHFLWMCLVFPNGIFQRQD